MHLTEAAARKRKGEDAAMVRCTDGDEPRDATTAEAAQIRTRNQPAHAVGDEHDALGARCGTHLFDLRVKLFGERLDVAERRPVIDRINGRDTAPCQETPYEKPHAIVDQDPVYQ